MSIISSKAERLYPTLTIDSTHDALAQVYTSDDLQEAYMAGASRKPTDEEIKAGAKAFYEALKPDSYPQLQYNIAAWNRICNGDKCFALTYKSLGGRR